MSLLRDAFAATALGSLIAAATAHDTWFEALPAAQARGGVAFALGTGTRFPVQQIPIYDEHLSSTGCRSAAGERSALRKLQDRPNAIWLRSALKPQSQPSCWAQVLPVEATLQPAIVEIYLDEIQAVAAVREAWAAQRARGVAWRERYTKHARAEVLPVGVPVSTRPVPMAMDVLLGADGPVAVGTPLTLQVLRNGKPLAGLPVELVNSLRASAGIWRRTDALGRVSFTPEWPGSWLLRGTELQLSTEEPELWESGFITLAFEVAASVRQ